MNHFRKQLEIEMSLTKNVLLNFPWEDPKAYGMWLAQTYNLVNYSTRLVALASAHCGLENEMLHTRFVDHAREERGHPMLCIRDLKALGYKYDDFPLVSQSYTMYQIQYYWIEKVNPASFFGYAFGLEAMAVNFGKEIFNRINDAHGVKAANFLRVHAEEDVHHVEDGFKLIDDLDEHSMQSAVENLKISCDTYRGMLQSVSNAYQHLDLGNEKAS